MLNTKHEGFNDPQIKNQEETHQSPNLTSPLDGEGLDICYYRKTHRVRSVTRQTALMSVSQLRKEYVYLRQLLAGIENPLSLGI